MLASSSWINSAFDLCAGDGDGSQVEDEPNLLDSNELLAGQLKKESLPENKPDILFLRDPRKPNANQLASHKNSI